LVTLIVLAALLSSIPALAGNAPVTPGDPRSVYIVVLNHGKGAEPDFGQGGAKQLARWSDRVVVELPPAAMAALQKHGRVNYIQHLTAGGPTSHSTATPTRFAAKTSAFKARSMDDSGGVFTWDTGEYHYDGSGNIDRMGPDDAGNTRRYKYDELDRLVEAGREASGAPAGACADITAAGCLDYAKYTYDSFGNRLTETTPKVTTTLKVNPAGTNHVSMDDSPITYDNVGNMTQGGGFSYKYDPFNNVQEIDAGGIQKLSIYDANDERIIVCGGTSGPCNWTLRGLQNEVLREYESESITSSSPYYLWTEDDVYRGALLAGAQRETADGGRLFFHLDHLGSPRLITNQDGRLIEKNEFAPFGRELASVTQEGELGYHTETHRFTGHERDFVEGVSDTANYVDYMHARTYTPALGRFLSVDPVLGDPHLPQSWNRYAYSLNNPTNRIDPTGLCDETAAAVGGLLQCWMTDLWHLATRSDAEKKAEQAAAASEDKAIARNVSLAEFKSGHDNGATPTYDEMLLTVPFGIVAGLGGRATAQAAEDVTTAVVPKVTPDVINAAMADAPLQSTQSAVSMPAIQRYVNRTMSGEVAPAIKVDGNLIVDGHHRYVAGRITGIEPAQQPATAPASARVYNWVTEVAKDILDWF